jgi:transposase InsO family protein
MTDSNQGIGTHQDRWARFRFSIVGPLLSAPPNSGELHAALAELAKKQWRHPITGEPVYFGLSTIERWLYQARRVQNPMAALKTKIRVDSGKARKLSVELKQAIRQQYKEHPSWSYQLHYDNLNSLVKKELELGLMPRYHTIRRFMKSQGYSKQRRVKKRDTVGAKVAQVRLETREVRSFEVEHVNALWHLDFHHGSCQILGKDGRWHKPLLLAILDDRSRLICHAQWYLDETVETLVHGFMQSLQKRALPRALMSDNGAAMIAAEFTQGLERLSILHQPTLPYSPYQNAKIEVLWAQIEGRLMPMLEGVTELTLSQLNEATIAWVEFEYHRKLHSEINCAPLERYLQGPDAGRLCPDTASLRHAFCAEIKRKQRKSDGTFSLQGGRFEVPSQYRHLEELCIHYARWDLSSISLVEPHTHQLLCKLYPLDKSENASGLRRAFSSSTGNLEDETTKTGIAPLLQDLMAEYSATGFPPGYIPKEKNQ